MNDDEFAKWDVIMFIDDDKKWVVQDVTDSHYALLELPMGDWPYPTPFAKGFCHWKSVKVGKWDNIMRREVDEQK